MKVTLDGSDSHTTLLWVFWHSLLLYLLSACQVYDPDLARINAIDADTAAVTMVNDSGIQNSDSTRVNDDTRVPGVADCIPNPDDDGTCPLICPEVCDDRDNDCDGATDEGEASDSCVLANAQARCAKGTCTITGCDYPFGDCDRVVANGCETALNNEFNCGGCGISCNELQNAQTVLCIADVCSPSRCEDGFDDCDADPSNGCETSLDTLDNCGGCGVKCDAKSCRGGICSQLDCEPGYADCDRDEDNKCEVSLNSVTNCGRCGNACSAGNASVTCEHGKCAVVKCKPGFDDCDGDESNGCETALDTVTDCGRCDKVCEVSVGVASCGGGVCTSAVCASGSADCDSDIDNGCETSLRTLDDCGMCGQPCTALRENQWVTCETGVCLLADCTAGSYDCDQDPLTGCESSLKDLQNCGECGRICDYDHAIASCSDGSCKMVSCESGFDNCNSDDTDGCETAVTTIDNCGECGRMCPHFEHTITGCSNGQCVVVACEAGWDDCDGDDSNGCETPLNTVENCGGCFFVCNVAGPFCCPNGYCAWWCL